MNGRLETELKYERYINNKLASMPAVAGDFYYYMSGANKSYATIYRYIMVLEDFISETWGNNKVDDTFYTKITSSMINKYFANMRTHEVNGKMERVSDSIRATRWSALNTFFNYLIMENKITENPMLKTQRPQVNDSPDVAFLTEPEVSLMLNNATKYSDARFTNRDLSLLKIGFGTGMRISAILQINIEDIDFKNLTIRVVEKGQKTKDIPIGENVLEQIKSWLDDRKKICNNDDCTAVFISSQHKRMSRENVQALLNKYSVGINKTVTPHVMRHTVATEIYKQTGDIYLCAKVLNHKNVATTQRYATMCDESRRKATNLLNNLVK